VSSKIIASLTSPANLSIAAISKIVANSVISAELSDPVVSEQDAFLEVIAELANITRSAKVVILRENASLELGADSEMDVGSKKNAISRTVVNLATIVH